jgi:hypothetical protein
LEIDETRQVTHKLTQAGNAVLTYDENGNTFMTSVKWMRMLLDKTANGNMIKSNFIGQTDPKRYNPHFDPDRIQKVQGDPLDYKANLERKDKSVKVKGDDW